MKSFSAIPVFIAVVECGSFSAAGQKLGTSKSAVSKRINQLEHDLGVRLLHRTTRRLSLTEAGEHYYDYARKAFFAACEGEDAITQWQGKPKGMLRVSVPMSFGRLHIAPLVSRFLSEYPDIQLNMTMDDKMVDLVEGGFDIAIRIGDLPDSSLIARRIAPCRSVVCASPEYVERHGRPKTPQDLQQHNCLVYSYFRGGSEWRFSGRNGVVKVLPKGNYQVNNSAAIREALITGLGIGQMPTFIVGPDLADGKLIPLLEGYSLPLHAIYAVFPERKHLPAKVRVFLDFVVKHLGEEQPYWDQY